MVLEEPEQPYLWNLKKISMAHPHPLLRDCWKKGIPTVEQNSKQQNQA